MSAEIPVKECNYSMLCMYVEVGFTKLCCYCLEMLKWPNIGHGTEKVPDRSVVKGTIDPWPFTINQCLVGFKHSLFPKKMDYRQG